VKDTNSWRMVSSEADGVPGLIVDRYGEVLVVQFLTLGMERLRGAVLEALEASAPGVRGVYERSESSSRRIEGLDDRIGWIRRECADEVEIVEGAARFGARFGEGHKTGFYLDQRENRLLLAREFAGGRVLDAFCYEGAFGVHLALAGSEVTGIEAQADAVRRAEEHRSRNGLDASKLRFVNANAFDELKRLEREKAQFDLVILDPPSFVKKKAALEGALAGYKEIALRSMRLLADGGRLAVFSCSFHVDEGLLMQACLSAALDTRKSLRVIRFLKQAADHPVDPFVPETYYLKGFLFDVSSI
jgi:23S rRNA (cytosine1962-C5)-methyltransferase